ncbi:MAG: hypothetical protein WCI05_00660 [Myxococcales bacterium]
MTGTEAGKDDGRMQVRSGDFPVPPFYRKGGAEAAALTADDVLRAAGIEPLRSLEATEVHALLKTDENFTSFIADDILEIYRGDAAELGIKGLSPDLLEKLYERMMYLLPRAQALEAASARAQHQKLTAISDLLDALLKIRRRVISHGEDDPELLARWDRVLTYFQQRYPGRTGATAAAAAAAAAAALPVKKDEPPK